MCDVARSGARAFRSSGALWFRSLFIGSPIASARASCSRVATGRRQNALCPRPCASGDGRPSSVCAVLTRCVPAGDLYQGLGRVRAGHTSANECDEGWVVPGLRFPCRQLVIASRAQKRSRAVVPARIDDAGPRLTATVNVCSIDNVVDVVNRLCSAPKFQVPVADELHSSYPLVWVSARLSTFWGIRKSERYSGYTSRRDGQQDCTRSGSRHGVVASHVCAGTGSPGSDRGSGGAA